MRIQDSFWQGSFGYWQNLFIHQHILEIGYTAWNGVLTLGRGIVICDVDLPSGAAVHWSMDTVKHQLQFLAQSKIKRDLQRLALESAIISELHQIVEIYDPTQEIITLISGNTSVNIYFLQQLKILPADCYKQVHQRLDEFPFTCQGKRRIDE